MVIEYTRKIIGIIRTIRYIYHLEVETYEFESNSPHSVRY